MGRAAQTGRTGAGAGGGRGGRTTAESRSSPLPNGSRWPWRERQSGRGEAEGGSSSSPRGARTPTAPLPRPCAAPSRLRQPSAARLRHPGDRLAALSDWRQPSAPFPRAGPSGSPSPALRTTAPPAPRGLHFNPVPSCEHS